MHGRTSVLSALAQPRRAASTAADLVVAHRALDGAVLSIEGAPTYAHAISTGAVPVFRVFQRAQPRGGAGAYDTRTAGRVCWAALARESHFLVPLNYAYVYIYSKF